MLIALLRGPRPPWIDRYHPRPSLARRSDERPEVGVRGQRVGAPQEDRARSVEALCIHAHGTTHAVGHADHAGGAANRAIEERGAELVEEPSIHRIVVQEPERAAERVRQDCLRPPHRDDLLEPARDLVERLLPGDRLEAPLTFRAHAAHRVEHAAGMIGTLQVPRDLRAEEAPSRRMIGIASYLDSSASLDRGQNGTGVRAVVRAHAPHDCRAWVFGDCGAHPKQCTTPSCGTFSTATSPPTDTADVSVDRVLIVDPPVDAAP